MDPDYWAWSPIIHRADKRTSLKSYAKKIDWMSVGSGDRAEEKCCCNWGAAVGGGGEHPEFECIDCPIHGGAFGPHSEMCKRHEKEFMVKYG